MYDTKEEEALKKDRGYIDSLLMMSIVLLSCYMTPFFYWHMSSIMEEERRVFKKDFDDAIQNHNY
jgi:hypothetical protein